MVHLNEKPAKGYNSPWLTWRCLNRLRTGYSCSKEQRKKWGYFNGGTCACGMDAENTAHMLRCSLLTHPCTLDDLLKFNDIGYQCTEQCKQKVGHGKQQAEVVECSGLKPCWSGAGRRYLIELKYPGLLLLGKEVTYCSGTHYSDTHLCHTYTVLSFTTLSHIL